jgi:hypothetical protein
VAGQQFEYSFDDIGNRKQSGGGGDEWGGRLSYQNYNANTLNQYTTPTVPGFVEVQGAATNFAAVTVRQWGRTHTFDIWLSGSGGARWKLG